MLKCPGVYFPGDFQRRNSRAKRHTHLVTACQNLINVSIYHLEDPGRSEEGEALSILELSFLESASRQVFYEPRCVFSAGVWSSWMWEITLRSPSTDSANTRCWESNIGFIALCVGRFYVISFRFGSFQSYWCSDCIGGICTMFNVTLVDLFCLRTV